MLESARRDGSSHALCYLDLDQFKVVNDTCGHLAGDALLERLAETLTFRVRQRDTVARLGGDEFAVLIEHCSVEQAMRVASTLHEAISEFVFTWEGKRFQVGVSVGLVPITPDLGDAADVLGAADSACYVAKDQGRNRIHMYAKDDAELARRRGEMSWVSHISGALAENRFRLRAQPVVPLMPRRAGAHHCELLVVMIDPDGKEIPPGSFLPAAERYNLATRIDRWVVRAALTWLADVRNERGRPALCGINLSAQSLGDTGFLEYVRAECAHAGVSASRLCFEITETAAIANLDTARRFMDALRSDGARFALDDFGKGLSSFGYLRSLPVDYVKIDAQFVRDLLHDPIDLAMVRSINEVARLMNKYTIAEGVESHEILAKLREVGVDYAQGYAIGVPRYID
jgi:diguanylate cyclase (GGDEF)-like protein